MIWYIILIIETAILLLSYILNFGWVRMVMLPLSIPYILVFIIVNLLFVKRMKSIKILNVLFLISGFSLIACNILLPDAADVPPSYYFFGLGKVDLEATKLWGISDRKSTRLNSSHANISY